MDLKEQLARQSLLLEFLSECAALAGVPAMLGTVGAHLHWIADYESCSLYLPCEDGMQHWFVTLGGEMRMVGPAELPDAHRAALDQAMAQAVPVLAQPSPAQGYGIALPLVGDGEPLGALCLGRASGPFSQGDARQLQHACRALGAALSRIVGARTEKLAQREVELAEARLRALAEDRALLAEQMIGIVSHDLRNPLAAITMGAAALGLGEDLPPRKARVLDSVAGAARRARRMVDDLLDFTLTRVGRGLNVARVAVDLHELVARSIEELTLTFEGHPLTHEAVGAGPVQADPDRIAQILGNLVANAIAYGRPGEPVAVASRIDGQDVTLCVHNAGAPIPPDLLANIFEPMVRGAARSNVRSVGLGLFIVRAIAEAHGGGVSVISSEDAGTTFTVRFPAM